MSGITSFTAIAADSAINFTWTVGADITVTNISKITIILNDFGVGVMEQYNVSATTIAQETGEVSVTLTSKITSFGGKALKNGVEYGGAILINTTTSSYSSQLISSVRPLSVPLKPVITVTATESQIHIKLTNYEADAHSSTGFSDLIAINVFLSEETTKYFRLVQLTPSDFGADLKTRKSLIHGEDGLVILNGKKYEVSLQAVNILGPSPISNTFEVTPSDLPGTIIDKLAMPRIVYDGSSVASAVILFGNTDDRAILSTAGYPVLDYKVYRYGVDVSDNKIESSKVLVSTITTLDPSSGLSTTPDVSYNFGSPSVNYPFRVFDTSVVLGTKYIYSIAGSNSNGTGIENYCDIMRAGKLADAPTLTLTPTDTNVSASAVVPANMGGFVPYTTAPDASGAVRNFFRYTWYVPDNSSVLQEVSVVDSSASSVSSSVALTNGITYTVKAQAITIYNNTPYYGAQATKTSTPYGKPPAPAALTISAVDANGPINGGLDFSWNAVTNKAGSTGDITYTIYSANQWGKYVQARDISGTTYRLTGLSNGGSLPFYVAANIFNTDASAIITGEYTLQQNASPFRLPNNAINLKVQRPGDSSFNILFDVSGNITGRPSSNIRSKVVVQELSGTVLVGVSSEYIINDNGSKIQSHSGVRGKSYQIDVFTGIFDGIKTYYNSTPTTISRTMYGFPDAPQNLQVQAMNGGFRVTWDKPANLNGTSLSGYRIVRGVSPGFTTVTTILGTEIEYFVAQGFTNGSLVNISVFTQASAEHETLPIESATPAGPVGVTPGNAPNAPTNLSANGADSQVTLTWTRDNDVAGYQVTQDDNPVYTRKYSDGNGAGWTFGVSTIEFIAPSLSNGTSYTFKISSFNTINSSNIYSPDTSISAVPFAAPSIPQSLTCTVASQSITSKWSAPSSTAGANLGDNGPILYRLIIDASYVDASLNPVTTNILDLKGIKSTEIPYTFAGTSLLNGRRYLVKVAAYFVNSKSKAEYVSNYTSQAIVVVNAPPQDVSGLTIVPGDKQNVLSWSNPTDGIAYPRTQIKIYRKFNTGSESLIATLTPASITTYTDTTLLNGGTYTYKVVSEHSSPAQQPSGVSIFGIPFGKPILVSATPNVGGSSTYNLQINKNGSNLLDYVAIGALPDGSGNVAIPVVQGTVPANAVYSGAAGATFDANQLYTLTLTMGVNVNAVLAVIENSAGFITKTIPIGIITTFGNL